LSYFQQSLYNFGSGVLQFFFFFFFFFISFPPLITTCEVHNYSSANWSSQPWAANSCHQIRYSLPVMEHEVAWLFSQWSAIGPHPKPNECNTNFQHTVTYPLISAFQVFSPYRISYMYYMPHLSHLLWFYWPNNVCWRTQIIKFFISSFF
jgi:hypothetical protein